MVSSIQLDDPTLAKCQARIGQVLQDKWRLDSILGVGGMAAVYAATHRNSKRVAVKMLHSELCGDAEVKKRFLREGYAANIIDHPGAVSVLDDDVAPDGAAFLVMELLEGETLEHRWERKGQKLPLIEVLDYTDQLLDVLAAAHAKSIVHRDIKPENLFLTKTGTIKVLDFGIARVFENTQSRSQTRAGMVMGTPAFMAPEQARARWDDVDGRTDLWAVGATMFTLLSGKQVHEAQTGNEQLIYSATKPARSLATVVQGLPRSVVATVDRALAFDRDQRWPDARSMQEAVRGSLEVLRAQAAGGYKGTIPSRDNLPAAHAAIERMSSAPTMLEHDALAGQIEALRPKVVEMEARVTAARRAVADAEARLNAVRNERATLEQRFRSQVGTRTVAVEEARKGVRAHLCELARRAMEDRNHFGEEYDATREEIGRLTRAHEARLRDVEIYALALESYDHAAFKRGIVVGIFGIIVALLLIIVPVVLKATWPAEPPPLEPPAAH